MEKRDETPELDAMDKTAHHVLLGKCAPISGQTSGYALRLREQMWITLWVNVHKSLWVDGA